MIENVKNLAIQNHTTENNLRQKHTHPTPHTSHSPTTTLSFLSLLAFYLHPRSTDVSCGIFSRAPATTAAPSAPKLLSASHIAAMPHTSHTTSHTVSVRLSACVMNARATHPIINNSLLGHKNLSPSFIKHNADSINQNISTKQIIPPIMSQLQPSTSPTFHFHTHTCTCTPHTIFTH